MLALPLLERDGEEAVDIDAEEDEMGAAVFAAARLVFAAADGGRDESEVTG